MQASLSTNGRTVRTKTAFRLSYAIATTIQAPPSRIWALLTNAADFPRWNSTVQSIEGKIAAGEKIKLRATVAPERVFNLTVSECVINTHMTWRDGMAPMFTGVRTYTLTPAAHGATDFAMVEVFSGLMLPMIAGSLPDFGPIFEQYAADLTREAQRMR